MKVDLMRFPVLSKVLAQVGTEQGIKLVGECYDLLGLGITEAFEASSVSTFVKALARGPLELAMRAGRLVVVDWARKQVPSGAQSTN